MRFDQQTSQTYIDIQKLLTVKEGDRLVLNPAYEDCRRILAETEEALKRLKEPIRVALAGYMKAGKSTLMNAIIGKKLAYTGTKITTYTPTHFRYNEKASIELVFRDGSRRAGLDIGALEDWTTVDEKKRHPEMEELDCVILYYPHEFLKEIELIDTPGLFSPIGDDSERTIRALGLKNLDEANRIGQEQVSVADAIIYAFSANFKDNDLNAVRAFTSTPINAIAVFTKIEQSYWSLSAPDKSPLDTMRPVIRRHEAELKNDLFRILPVTAILAEGAASLENEDWDALRALASGDFSVVRKSLYSPQYFLKVPSGDVSTERRERLLRLLDRYGIYCAVRAIRDGVGRDELAEHLKNLSGVEALVEQIRSHFGVRSFAIKTEAAFGRIEREIQRVQYSQNVSPTSRMACQQIRQRLKEARNSRAFIELNLLRDYYEEKLRFPTESDNEAFLCLMGERGNHAAVRAGLRESASVDEILTALENLYRRWSEISYDYTLARTVRLAAENVRESVNELLYHAEMLSSF